MGWTRYAIYWVPGGRLGALGADWLGWDARRARAVGGSVFKAPGARRYGFHATLKQPFRLAGGRSEAELLRAARALAGGLALPDPVRLDVAWIGGFLALRPVDPSGLAVVADATMRTLDAFRGAPHADEMAKRRVGGLTARQEQHLTKWGYPHVFEDFHPHLTLSDTGGDTDAEVLARSHFAPVLDRPHAFDRISLMGEDALGRFHEIEDVPLGHVRASASSAESAARMA